jgi:tetratricopeptide (TPR) repeat protein
MGLNRRQRRTQDKIQSMQQSSASSSLSGILKVGLRHHQAGQLAEAKAYYIQVLNAQPSQSEALHLLGLIAHQVGQHGVAVETIGRAVEIEPQFALYRCSLGNALKALRRLDEATDAYTQAIRLKPDFAEAHYNRGTVLAELGRIADAAGAYTTAICLKPDFLEAHYNLGTLLLEAGRFERALAAFHTTIRLNPDHAEAHANLGKTLQQLNRLGEALSAFETTIRIRPDYAEAHSNRGTVLKDLGRLGEALEACGSAIRLKPACAEAHSNLGTVMLELGRLDDATAAHKTAIRLRPDFAEAHYNLGNTLKAQGHLEDSIDAFDHAVRARPNFAEAHVNLGMQRLLAGDFPGGWADYEWRLRGASPHLHARTFSQPQWRGEDLAGQRIMLHAEQGLGDTIQFCRYVSLVAARGGCVILEAPKALLRLLSGLQGVTQMIAAGDPLPPFDVQSSLMSLPLAFETTIDTIPGQRPYLIASPEKTAYWQARLGPKSKRRVGLVWNGGLRLDQPELHALNERRNIPLQVIGQLNHPAIDFFSLQKGAPAESQLIALKDAIWTGGNFTNPAPDIDDFEDTAGLIENLDLVISVDTSTAHLAAAMGKPVWLLNRFDSCWRWMEHRADSPWYPTLRLFRQAGPGDWQGVIKRVAAALDRLS